MEPNDYIVPDSSIWRNTQANAINISKNTVIRIGMVREEKTRDKSGRTLYIVEVADERGQYPIVCTRSSRFGGAYNYEEYTHQTYSAQNSPESAASYEVRPGDLVIVVCLNGDTSDGIILGGVSHPSRPEKLAANNEVAYISEFNGIETSISNSGEFIQTFKGVPTNINILNEEPTGVTIPTPTYDMEVGTSYYKWDADGSFEVSDNATSDLQSIKINKPGGKIIITSGATTLTIDKAEESYTINNKLTTFNSSDKFNIATTDMDIEASASYTMKSKKITTEGIWDQKGNMKILGNIEQTGNQMVTGNIQCINLTTSGVTKLGGGDNPIVYDIILIMGIGNLGAPVISYPLMLKTVLTKAT